MEALQHLIAACNGHIEKELARLETKATPHPRPPPGNRHRQAQHNEPSFAARAELHRLCGVVRTQLPGMRANTAALVFFTERGPDFVARFRTAKCFAAWLGFCPDTRITGGKFISARKTRCEKPQRQSLALGGA